MIDRKPSAWPPRPLYEPKAVSTPNVQCSNYYPFDAPHRVEENTRLWNVKSQLVVTLHKYRDFHFLFSVLIGKVEQKPKHQLQIQDKVGFWGGGASTPLGRAKSTGALKDVSPNKSHSEAMQLFLERESPLYNNNSGEAFARLCGKSYLDYYEICV